MDQAAPTKVETGEASRPVAPGSRLPHGQSLRTRLRDGTRALHERLDAGFVGVAMSRDRAAYARFLRVNEACCGRIEPVLAASGLLERMPGLDGGFRRGAARADLDAMRIPPLALAPFPLAGPSLCEAIGVAYVMEGSRLGARMILKEFGSARDAETDRGLTTFFLEAAGNADRFREFMRMAEALAATPSDRDGAVRGAIATFDYFLEAARIADAADSDGIRR
jgi:heme oxygenase (biliverdin-IX-beta and delta-forming)